ncbi:MULTISPECIES: hypothetical protein [unclassified Modestobacter]
MSARIRVCRDRLDTTEVRWLLGCTDVTAGRVVLRPSSQAAVGATVVSDLLDALGITGTQRRTDRAHQSVLDHVLPWLLAYRIRDLVVHGYTSMTLDALRLLLDLTDATGVRLWLTGRTTDERLQIATARGATTATWTEVHAALTATAAQPTDNPDAEGPDVAWVCPPVPADDFLTFRAAARATLPAEQLTAVDAVYLATLTEARSRLAGPLAGDGTLADDQLPGGRPLLARDRLEATVAQYLHTLVMRSATAAELTVRLRAAQTAAFHLGWQLQVRLERLVNTASAPSAAAARSRSTWQVLRLYRDPVIGATLVLTALGCDVATMLALPAAAVAADGSTVTVHGAPLPTPPGAAVLLRAQRFAGQLTGRSPAEPFLHAAGEPVTDAKIASIVHAAVKDAGVPLASRVVDHTWNGRQWLTRWGVTLQEVS